MKILFFEKMYTYNCACAYAIIEGSRLLIIRQWYLLINLWYEFVNTAVRCPASTVHVVQISEKVCTHRGILKGQSPWVNLVTWCLICSIEAHPFMIRYDHAKIIISKINVWTKSNRTQNEARDVTYSTWSWTLCSSLKEQKYEAFLTAYKIIESSSEKWLSF